MEKGGPPRPPQSIRALAYLGGVVLERAGRRAGRPSERGLPARHLSHFSLFNSAPVQNV